MKTEKIKEKRNVSKHFLSKTVGFTLVELIIVITILAILATIAFISFKSYSGNARDGNRVSTLKSIEKGLELYFVKTGEFPTPDGSILTGSMSGTQIMYSGEIGENISSAIKLNKLALDPTLGKTYKYGITYNKQEYNLGGIGESDTFSQNIIPTTYANMYYGQVVGNYRGYIKYSTGTSHYLTNVPSLIYTYSGSISDVFNDKNNVHFVIKKGENIPYEISGKVNNENPDDVVKRKTGKQQAKFINLDITEVVNASSAEDKETALNNVLNSNPNTDYTKDTLLESFGSDDEEMFETIVNGGIPQTTSNNSSSENNCNVDEYREDGTTCITVGIGYYSPDGDTNRSECSNKPALHSEYTGMGNGINECPYTCTGGYTGTNCDVIKVGTNYMTTPGGCTDSPTPTCNGTTDTLKKQWKIDHSYTPDSSDTADGSFNIGTFNAEHPASEYCQNMIYGGYDDWYLPSQDELNFLYINRVSIGGFASDSYWSSTQAIPSTTGAWAQYFSHGAQYHSSNGQPIPSLFRCIRKF